MGNYRFKFSDMIPNAWFYKLKDMNRAMSHTNTSPTSKKRNPSHQNSTNHHPLKPHHHNQHHSSLPRKSYYFPRDLSPKLSAEPGQPDPPRRSSKHSRARAKRSPRPGAATAQAQSSSTSCSCRASLDSVWTRTESLAESPDSILDSSPEFRLDRVLTPESFGTPCDCGAKPVSTDDIVIHVNENSFNRNPEKLRSFDTFPELELPPIVTKPKLSQPKYSENRDTQKSGPNGERRAPIKQKTGGGGKKFSVHSPGKRLRIRSPRIQAQLAARRVAGSETGGSKNTRSRRTLSESFAIVKSSFDPQKDFRESMLEMIVEHNIKASKDLEELLACYLSLNSDEYHELIIKVFKQIWFDLTDISFK